MRSMSGVAFDNVQAMFPAPVFRASETSVSACRLVSGQERFGATAAAWQVDSVSGAGLAGAADLLGLVALADGLLARHGYAGESGQERPRPVIQPVGDNGGSSERDGDKGGNGTKPVNPWDFRTSSPPG